MWLAESECWTDRLKLAQDPPLAVAGQPDLPFSNVGFYPDDLPVDRIKLDAIHASLFPRTRPWFSRPSVRQRDLAAFR